MERNNKLPHGRPSLYREEYDELLIQHMEKGYSFESFAGVIGVCWDTLHEWVKVHPSFSEAKNLGKAKALKWWEGILRGGAGGRIAGYNATSVIFALKNKAPQVWRDRVKIDADLNITGSTFEKMDDEQKAKILKAALDAKLLKDQDDQNHE